MTDAVRTVVVAGAATGVGKTWVAARLVEGLRDRGVQAAVFKPVQSYDPAAGPTDARILAAAAGVQEARVCPPGRSYPLPMAPPIAAEQLGRPPFTVADLVAGMQLPDRGLALIEAVGGPLSPLAADGDTVGLANALGADLVIVVADAGLGAINAVLLASKALEGHRLVAFLNRFDESDLVHRENLRWLKDSLEVEHEVDALVKRLEVLAPLGAGR